MRRYWTEESEWTSDSEITLVGEDYHHIVQVCRMDIGSRFEILLEGEARLVEVVQRGKKEATARVIETRPIAPPPGPRLVLVLSIPKFPVLDAVIEKMVELGVHEIQPVYSDFSFIRSQDSVWEKKKARLAKIVKSATSQTGRADLMTVANPISLSQILNSWPEINRNRDAWGLFAYEGGRSSVSVQSNELNQAIRNLTSLGQQPHEVHLFVGSEGGFSDSEVQKFADQGLQPTTFGSQVLRVETACVALVSILKYQLRGDYGK